MEARLCPSERCTPRLFQLVEIIGDGEWASDEKRLHRVPHIPGTTCPYCGHDSDDDHDFVDPKDVEALTEWFKWAASEDAQDAVENTFKNIGRGLPRGGPVSIELKTSRSHQPEPRMWREDLLRDLTCSVCSRRYGVYAIGLFCPDCGAPNLIVHFRRERELIAKQIDLARNAENAELSFRLLGNAHEDVVTALETYLKTIYRYLYRYLLTKRRPDEETASLMTARAIGNAFQNVGRAREKFTKLEINPFEALDNNELAYLKLNIEKRHVLGHNLGLADEKYAEIASSEQPGRTVTLLAEEVSKFANLAGRVVDALESEAFPE